MYFVHDLSKRMMTLTIKKTNWIYTKVPFIFYSFKALIFKEMRLSRSHTPMCCAHFPTLLCLPIWLLASCVAAANSVIITSASSSVCVRTLISSLSFSFIFVPFVFFFFCCEDDRMANGTCFNRCCWSEWWWWRVFSERILLILFLLSDDPTTITTETTTISTHAHKPRIANHHKQPIIIIIIAITNNTFRKLFLDQNDQNLFQICPFSWHSCNDPFPPTGNRFEVANHIRNRNLYSHCHLSSSWN